MQFSLRQLMLAVTCVCIVIAMYAHGNSLLGRGGIAFGLLSAVTLYVVWRVFSQRRNYHRVRQAIAVIFAIAVFTFLMFPGQFSSDMASRIDGRKAEVERQSQVNRVLSSDRRFGRVTAEFPYYYGGKRGTERFTAVHLAGEIDSETDFLELRDRLFDKWRVSHWNLAIAKTGIVYEGSDDDLFGRLWGEAERWRRGQDHDLNRVGAPAGDDPTLTLMQQAKAFTALEHVVALEIDQLDDRGLREDARVAVADAEEIRQVISWLSFTPYGPRVGEGAGPRLLFRLPNDRVITIHVRDGKWWCFTGGVRRRLDPKLWDYLERKRAEHGI